MIAHGFTRVNTTLMLIPSKSIALIAAYRLMHVTIMWRASTVTEQRGSVG